MIRAAAALALIQLAPASAIEQMGTLTVKNGALGRVRVRDASCQASDVVLDATEEHDIPLKEGAHKYWVVPDGCTEAEGCYDCGLDCLGCFYIAPIVGSNGVAVTGIGYGHNVPVKVHEGVSGAHLSATNQLGQPDSAECNTNSCNFNHIIQAQGNMVFSLEGGSSAVRSEQAQASVLTVKNTASSRVMLRDASCKADDLVFEAGHQQDIPLSEGAHKYWVVPEGCTEAEGCYKCGLDCLGCFYIAPIVGSNGVAVTGIGYGHNTAVKVHEGVSGAHFSATNQLGQPDSAECNSNSCNFNHIIQAHGSMTFTVEGSSSRANVVV